MTNIRCSILDRSPIISGFTPAQAIQETIGLAQAAERFGYYRYWLAKHHAIAALAGAGSIAGAWISDAATYAQALLVVGLAVAFLVVNRRGRLIVG